MSVTEIPETDRTWGYDYTNGNWVRVATNASGRVGIAHGETITAYETLCVTDASGGQVFGSGKIDRLIISVPNVLISGTNNYAAYWLSGTPDGGIFIGGKSGNAPFSDTNFVGSGKGLFIGPGHEKTIYVQDLNEVYACAVRSGDPITYISEITTA